MAHVWPQSLHWGQATPAMRGQVDGGGGHLGTNRPTREEAGRTSGWQRASGQGGGGRQGTSTPSRAWGPPSELLGSVGPGEVTLVKGPFPAPAQGSPRAVFTLEKAPRG